MILYIPSGAGFIPSTVDLDCFISASTLTHHLKPYFPVTKNQLTHRFTLKCGLEWCVDTSDASRTPLTDYRLGNFFWAYLSPLSLPRLSDQGCNEGGVRSTGFTKGLVNTLRFFNTQTHGARVIIWHQPKQYTIVRDIFQNHHTFALFDPHKMNNLMTPCGVCWIFLSLRPLEGFGGMGWRGFGFEGKGSYFIIIICKHKT